MTTTTNSRAVFWWCLSGLILTIGAVWSVASIETTSIQATTEQPTSPPTTVLEEEPPVAFFSEGPDHNPCAYPHDCRPGHTITTLECGYIDANPVPESNGKLWSIEPKFDHKDPRCKPHTSHAWDSQAPDGIAVCRPNFTLYQDGKIVSDEFKQSPDYEGVFLVELRSTDNLLFEFVFRCTSDNNPDYPHPSTELRQFYR